MADKHPPRKGPAAASSTGPGAVRIIGGTLRGRKLAFGPEGPTRPMKDRVRESVFNLLGTSVVGTWVLDLFAGTGALGLEALSRGATRALLLERHIPTAQTLKRNLVQLDLTERGTVQSADTFIWLRRFVPSETIPWLVFCSPPYDLFVERVAEMLALLDRLIELAPLQSQFVVESDQRFDVARLNSTLVWDVRTYPPATIALGEKMPDTNSK